MENTLISTAQLKQNILSWMTKVRREKPASFVGSFPIVLDSCDADKQEICLRLHTTDFMENPWGVTHGGMLALAADWAMGIAARTILNQNQTPTVSMQMDYLRPVPLHTDLILRVRVLSAGKNLTRIRVEGFLDGTEKILVTATGTYFLYNLPLEL